MDLKTEIHDYLDRSGIKPYELADKAGISRTSLYRFLKGERGLLLDTAEKIRKLLYPDEKAA
ncbi:helix-turn-helix domain-containing protein [Candidatus Pacearchaeota archaeon]|nr:helix-turn-helix domain-containing protein [Candidatus Pacearchaeota archaeon]